MLTSRKRLFPVVVSVAALGLTLAACGGAKSNASNLSAGAGASRAPAGSAAVVKLVDSSVGEILTDGSGRTLYLFEADKSSTSTCSDACAKVWPPLLSTGSPTAGTGTKAGSLGMTKRSDGTNEVTYAGHPLYYYVADGNTPGVVRGQGITSFGAEWDPVSAAGTTVEKSGGDDSTPSASPSDDSGSSDYHY